MSSGRFMVAVLLLFQLLGCIKNEWFSGRTSVFGRRAFAWPAPDRWPLHG